MLAPVDIADVVTVIHRMELVSIRNMQPASVAQADAHPTGDQQIAGLFPTPPHPTPGFGNILSQ